MNRSAIALLLLLAHTAAPAALATGKLHPEFALTATGELEIGPDGSVHRHDLDDGLSPAVQALVERNVATWRFEPILQAGKPVIARTRMSLAIDALPSSEGDYLLKISNVWFGSPQGKGKLTPPSYPTEAIKAGLGARVMLVIEIDPHGNVVDAHPYQTSLSMKAREAVANRWRKRFEARSIAAVRGLKFSPGERKDQAKWRAYAPGPITPAPWVDAASLASVDTDALQDSVPATLDSRFRLLSDIHDKSL